MKKGITLSLLTINILYASVVDTSEKTYGLFFGNVANAKGEATIKDYGRENALLGCLHNRGGSDTIGYADCTELVQIYSDNTNQTIDSKKFRDNVWCMESKNANLGKENKPNAENFSEDISNDGNVLNFNSSIDFPYETSLFKYSDGNYQESYKNLRASTTGRLLVLARNKEGYNPFSFYLTSHLNSKANTDLVRFINGYVGILNGNMYGEYIKPYDYIDKTYKLMGKYQGWIGWQNASRSDGGTNASKGGCNEANGYGAGFKKGGKGCGVSEWSKLNFIERYVRFYYDLRNYGCSIRPVNIWEPEKGEWLREDVARYNWTPLYGGIINDNGETLYYRTFGNATNGQVNIDKEHVKNARTFDLKRVIGSNETCKQAVEMMTVKNIATYGYKDLNNSNNWDFFNKTLENDAYLGSRAGFKQNIGKCYFVNLQYNDKKYDTKNYTAFIALSAYKFLWGNHDRFLQNYLKDDGKYAVANYSIDRKNIYKSDKPGSETSIFSLHTRPTSFRGVDENRYGNTKDGRLEAKYNLIFYPDANDSKMSLIYNDEAQVKTKVKNAPSNLSNIQDGIPLITSLEFGIDNNAQLSFMHDNEDLDPNRIDFNGKKCNIETIKECENMNFNFSFQYKIHKLKKEGGYFDLISEDKDYKSASYTTKGMAVRVDENLLEAINYNSKKDGPILLEMKVENGYYDSDKRPFFEQDSKDIIKANQVGSFVVVIDIDFSGSDIVWGSIWDLKDANKIPDINSSNTRYDESKAFTRVVGTPIFLGIKNKSKKQFIGSDTFITFNAYQIDNNNKRKELDSSKIKFYEGSNEIKLNYDQQNLFNDEKIKNFTYKGSYPYYNGVLKLDDLEVGRYEICYNIYSINDISSATQKASDNIIEIPIKASGCTNKFSIRPAFIEYSTKTNFVAGENALSGGKLTEFNVSLKDSSKKDINTNENFAITKTDLIVENSKLNKYIFDLNNKNRSAISSTNPQAINKKGDNSYIINDVYVNFPLSTEAKLQMYEGAFTKDDSLGGFCNSGSANNAIGSDGKIGCLITSENPIALNFSSTRDYALKDAIINNAYTNTKVFFKSEIGDQNSLKIPFVLNNQGINNPASLPYVYHKFNDNLELEYDLNFDNEDDAAKNRYLVNIDEVYTDSSYLVNVAKKNIKVTKVILSKDKLNQEFDKKLEELYNETRTTNINGVIEKYGAKPDKISVDLELAYSRYKKTLDNKTLDNSLVTKPDVEEFSLLRSSSIGEVGKTKFNPNKDYSFIYTGVTYKDSKIQNSNTITLKSSDLELFYLGKKSIKVKFTPETPTYKKSAKDIIDELRFIGDYGSSFAKNKGDLEVTLNPSHSNKQYVKEIVNISNTSDLSGSSFSIEFANK